ncbi:MAG TPA: DHHA1 domain-containing protein [Gemmatimonadales bacterium]
MTDRLYYHDSYLRSFTARLAGRRTRDGRTEVSLDRTAFYPEGGGQPPDHGLLDAARVVDVQADEDGSVWHAIDGQLDGEDEVFGQVEWPRRFDHMQQHHGQHLLSAAFEELFQLPTLAFHLGAEYATIDLPGDVAEPTIRAAEDRTNEIVWEDRLVEARFVSAAELATIPLRKPPTVQGPVRVVSVPGFDHSACGGTHPRTTGAVGVLHVRRRERRGGDTRIEFVCGGRALRDLRDRGGLLTRIASGMSVGLDELEEAIGRLRDQEAGHRKRLGHAMERLVAFEARDLVAAAPRHGGVPIVRQFRDGLDMNEARLLATAIVAEGGVALLGLRGEKAQVLIARPAGHAFDCGKVLREALAAVGGRGGGQPQMAQGGIPDPAQLEMVLAELEAGLRE